MKELKTLMPNRKYHPLALSWQTSDISTYNSLL